VGGCVCGGGVGATKLKLLSPGCQATDSPCGEPPLRLCLPVRTLARRLAMAGGAGTLVLESHGALLRLLAKASGRHVTGLSQASCSLQGMPLRLKKRLQRLDLACAIVRHITQPYVEELTKEVTLFLDNWPAASASRGVAEGLPSSEVDADASDEALSSASGVSSPTSVGAGCLDPEVAHP
jgi:hypothetical protein